MERFGSQLPLHSVASSPSTGRVFSSGRFSLLSSNLVEMVGVGEEAGAEGGSGACRDYLCLLCSVAWFPSSLTCCRRGLGLLTQIRGVGPNRTQFLLAGTGAPAASPLAGAGDVGSS